MSIPTNLIPPKLCCLKKWSTYVGYGFNLHAEKGKPGQYVGKVDPNSPAELGGLNPKYFLVEVNGSNVEDLSHQNVVERIKDRSEQVTLLVAHAETYKYCKEHSIVINSHMPEVVSFTTPDEQPDANEMIQREELSSTQQASAPPTQPAEKPADASRPTSYEQIDYHVPVEKPIVTPSAASQSEATERPSVAAAAPQPQRRAADPVPAPPAAQAATPPSPAASVSSSASASAASASASGSHNGGGASAAASSSADPVGNISLEEMRAKLGRNKRTQVKLNQTPFSEKSNMFQAL